MGKRLVWLRRGKTRRRLRTGKWQNSRKRKARAQEGPCPAAGCARLGRGSLPPAEPEKNGPSAARAPGFSRWESALFGCAGPTSRRWLLTGKWQNSRKRKARAQEGPCPTAGYARLGRGSLPPAEPEKNGPSTARAPGFWGWESALFGCAGPMSRRRLRTGK